jgi:4-diphosphocytidyl-2-C-methyl-D-erythritol kinase
MQFHAPAKVNLSLNVFATRADGYHDISSCAGFVDVYDTLTLEASNRLSIEVTGPFAQAAGSEKDNICLRAATQLQATLGIDTGVHITLDKQIPVGAGLGGGSSDAAAILCHLPEFWGAVCTQEQRLACAKPLGADVPVCLQPSGLWLMEGTGHDVTRLTQQMSGYVVLVYPHVHMDTASVYKAFSAVGSPTVAADIPAWARMNEDAWFQRALRMSKNDLQRPAVAVHHVVVEVLQALEFALPEPELVRMSGSGSCCYALYHEKSQAESLASSLRAAHPDWWVRVAQWLH